MNTPDRKRPRYRSRKTRNARRHPPPGVQFLHPDEPILAQIRRLKGQNDG
ncbi:hypothetical protein [Bordetella petrii]|nr:hypothetical protein [Bordetella petrii]